MPINQVSISVSRESFKIADFIEATALRSGSFFLHPPRLAMLALGGAGLQWLGPLAVQWAQATESHRLQSLDAPTHRHVAPIAELIHADLDVVGAEGFPQNSSSSGPRSGAANLMPILHRLPCRSYDLGQCISNLSIQGFHVLGGSPVRFFEDRCDAAEASSFEGRTS